MPKGISFLLPINDLMKNLRFVYNDTQLGNIYILSNKKARNIIMRVKADGVYVTASPFSSIAHIREVLEVYRERLNQRKAGLGKVPVYDEHFKIETDCMKLYFRESGFDRFFISSEDGTVIIHYPAGVDFFGNGMQEWLHKVVCEALRKQALSYLPLRLQTLAARFGFSYNKVTIRGSQSRWGSCSSQKNISLSYYLMTLPSILLDAVLIHELCHTVEMNHGPRFWDLMDKCTNNRSKELSAQIKRYRTEI